MKKYILALSCLLLLIGCKQEDNIKTPDQLFKERSSGVVLIYSKNYYEFTLPTGQTMYMTVNEEGELDNFTSERNIIEQVCGGKTGTGFFIDEEGHIMTNRHVVDVSINEYKTKQKIVSFLREERQAYLDSLELARRVYAKLEENKQNCYSYDFYGNCIGVNNQLLQEIHENQQYVENKFEYWKLLCENINANMNANAIRIKPVSYLGIAYNESFVTSEEDFFITNACSISKISKRENADLAIIQLKQKKTPEFAYVFDISGIVRKEKEDKSIVDNITEFLTGKKVMEEVRNDELKMNQQLYMIGYNSGFNIAITRKGIKAQMTSGKLTQLSDGERILYSIPTMQGSSGSPVIDEFGNVRGVNFAKATLNDDFNFGVPMNLIQNFLKE